MTPHKIIGVPGGMVPEASASLYTKIIRYTQNRSGAVQDSDYPPLIIDSLTLKDFDETGIVNADSMKRQLIDGVKKLENAGCELIIIGCNTVHVFYDAMQEAVSIPILNIVGETRNRGERRGLFTGGQAS